MVELSDRLAKFLMVMAAAGYYLQQFGVRLLVTIAAGAVVYAVGLLVVRYLDDEEVTALKHVVGRDG